MVFVNEFINADEKPRQAMESFLILLAPLAPHIAEEMWSRLGHPDTIAYEPWPAYDESKIAEDEIEIVLQVNSKIKGKVMVPAGIDTPDLEKIALDNDLIRNLIEGLTVRKVIAVTGKLVNVIAS
jgi:leucyl-tRNA synthetase